MTYYVDPGYVDINYVDPSEVSIFDSLLVTGEVSIFVCAEGIDLEVFEELWVSGDVYCSLGEIYYVDPGYVDINYLCPAEIAFYEEVSLEESVTCYSDFNIETAEFVVSEEWIRNYILLSIFGVEEVTIAEYSLVSYVIAGQGTFMFIESIRLMAPEIKVELVYAS